MDCGVVMKRRILKQTPAGFAIPKLVRTRAYHEQLVAVGAASFARIFRCEPCCQKPLDAERVTRQIRLAWMQEMAVAGKSLTQRKVALKACESLRVTGEVN